MHSGALAKLLRRVSKIRLSSGGTRVFSSHATLALLISASLLAPPAFAVRAHTASASSHSSTSHKTSHRRHKVRRPRGQQQIEPDRVMQIQQALIREHYLAGDADGKWNASTIAAMQKYQADNGWQTKLTPDSRALKKLGLGPDYSDAINAKGSNFSAPTASSDMPATQAAGFIEASGVHQ
jgi:Putative peptidoglycan binding domain